MAETLINDFLVTVGGSGVSSSAGTMQVSAVASVDSGFRVLIGAELMYVTSGGTTTNWNVSRGVESTTAAAHNLGDPIHIVMTATGLTNLMSQFLIQPLGLWVSGTTYSQYQMVYWKSSQYISLLSSNTANQPDTSPSYWQIFLRAPTSQGSYNAGTTYLINDMVMYNYNTYISILNANTGNQPDISPTYWNLLATAVVPTGATGLVYSGMAQAGLLCGISYNATSNGSVVGTMLGQPWLTLPTIGGPFWYGTAITAPQAAVPDYIPYNVTTGSLSNWQIQMTSVFTAPVGTTGTWTFYTNSSQGSNLLINGTTVVSNGLGTAQANTEVSGTYSITAGNTYYMLMQWGHGTGGFQFGMHWTQPSSGTKASYTDASGAYNSPFLPGSVTVTGLRFGDQVLLKKTSDDSTLASGQNWDYSATTLPLPIYSIYSQLPLSCYLQIYDISGNLIVTSASRSIVGGEVFRVMPV